MTKRKTKAELERILREQKRAEMDRRRQEKERAKAAKQARLREEAKRREWLRAQRSRPRLEVPSEYRGETIYVHKKIYDRFLKRRDITITRCYPKGGAGGSLIVEYRTNAGGRGVMELLDLGPMPV